LRRHSTAASERNALEFPDGKIVLLNHLKVGQRATVLQAAGDVRRESA
jgi:hypothetical protein